MILNIVQYQYWVLDLNMAQCQYGELELEHGSASIEKVASMKHQIIFEFFKERNNVLAWIEFIYQKIDSVKWHRCSIDMIQWIAISYRERGNGAMPILDEAHILGGVSRGIEAYLSTKYGIDLSLLAIVHKMLNTKRSRKFITCSWKRTELE